MMNNLNDMMNLYQQMMNNPQQFLSRRFNLPQGMNMNNPNDIIQHLLNSGQISQDQVNRVMQIKNSPVLQKLIGH